MRRAPPLRPRRKGGAFFRRVSRDGRAGRANADRMLGHQAPSSCAWSCRATGIVGRAQVRAEFRIAALVTGTTMGRRALDRAPARRGPRGVGVPQAMPAVEPAVLSDAKGPCRRRPRLGDVGDVSLEATAMLDVRWGRTILRRRVDRSRRWAAKSIWLLVGEVSGSERTTMHAGVDRSSWPSRVCRGVSDGQGRKAGKNLGLQKSHA